MSAPSPLDTLFFLFEQNLIDWDDQSTLFMGADSLDGMKPCEVWQVFKPAVDRLDVNQNHPPEIFPKDRHYKNVLILLPKQVQEAKSWIAQGLSVLAEDGTLIAAAANDAGGNRLPKWFQEAGCGVIQSEARNKSRVVWAARPSEISGITAQWIADGGVRVHNFGGGLSLFTQPGLFSWDRIDPASRLLAGHFPPALAGHGADFGCGWGFLSHCALRQFPKIKSLVLAEADARALSCAMANIEGVRDGRDILPLWHDLTKNFTPPQPLDFVLMNPPFHTGKKTDIDLGQKFIRTAADVLKKGGSLSLVANNHLPYEAVCEALFKNVKIVVQQDGFKIIRAVK